MPDIPERDDAKSVIGFVTVDGMQPMTAIVIVQ